MPTEAAFRVGDKFKNGFIEFSIGTVFLYMLLVDLGRDNDKHSKNQRNKKLAESLACKLPGGAFAQRHVGAGTRYEKQQRHAEVMRPHHPVLESHGCFVVLDMPSPGVEKHTGMKEKEDENGDQPKPIQVVTANRLLHGL